MMVVMFCIKLTILINNCVISEQIQLPFYKQFVIKFDNYPADDESIFACLTMYYMYIELYSLSILVSYGDCKLSSILSFNTCIRGTFCRLGYFRIIFICYFCSHFFRYKQN